ncbi:hypothetical protein K7432_006156 [Basidiobolus ranarum]|uniref:Mitochondrial carrier protein n=1 Tax=Basidiobolus ranarum TaxID=34480 RepID=A0ABR2W225_9FUNG
MISAAVKYGGFDIIHRYVLPPLLANTAVGISLFTVYTATLLSLDPDSGLNPSGYKTFSNAFTAGALAGAVSSTIATPLDSIQARFHVQEMIDGKFKSVMAYTKSMVQELGVATLYRGLGLTLVKDALGYGIFFGVFELAKKQGYKMAVEHANRDRDLADVNSQLVKPKFWVQPLLVLGSGALAAIFYQAVDHPFEQIRKVFFVKASQAEIRYRTRTTYVETIRECIRLGNKKGYQQFLFKGVVTNALRAVPASSLGLLCFEYLRNEFEHDLELMSKP